MKLESLKKMDLSRYREICRVAAALAAGALTVCLHANPGGAMLFLLGFAAVAGVFAGAERSGRHLLLGGLAAMLPGVVFAIMTAVDAEPVKRLLMDDLPGLGLAFQSESAALEALDGVYVRAVVAVIVGMVLVYLVFFNCRLLAGKFAGGLAGGVLAVVLWHYPLVGAVYGMAGFHVMLGPNQEGMNSLSNAMLTGAGLLLLLLAGWTVLNVRRRRAGFKKLLIDIGIFVAGCFVLWSVSAVAAYGYATVMAAKSERRFPPVQRDGVSAALAARETAWKKYIDEFYAKHPDFQLPAESIYSWLEPATDRGGKAVVPEAMRIATLKLVSSPEGEEFFRKNSEAIDLYVEIIRNFKHESLADRPDLSAWRAIARRSWGQAYLYYYLNRQDDILPALLESERLEDAIYAYEMTGIEALVRNAIQFARLYSIVTFGPEGRAFAPFYREQLTKVSARPIRIPNDAPLLTKELKRVLAFEPARPDAKAGLVGRLLGFPCVSASIARMISSQLAAQAVIDRFPGGIPPARLDGDPAAGTLAMYQKALLYAAMNKALCTVGLALKAYRCEHDRYPDRLADLCPAYLSELPADPADGGALSYSLLPNGHFKLVIPSMPIKQIISEPAY
jgi:hypothetical protein